MAVHDTIDKQARDLIKAEGYWVAKIHKILSADCDGDREVLFAGKYKGDKAMKIAGEDEEALYTLTLRGEGTGYVSSGW